MKRKFVWLVVSCLVAISLILVSCAPAVTEEEEVTIEEVVTEEEVVGPLPGYKYHAEYPIILSLSDNYGNVMKKSRFNEWQGPDYLSSETGTTVRVGDTITLKIEAWDPKDREISYRWKSTSSSFNKLYSFDEGLTQKWYTSNEISYTLVEEDVRSAGGTSLRFTVAGIKTGERNRLHQLLIDDSEASLTYTVMP